MPFHSPPGGHASGDLSAGAAPGTRKGEGDGEGEGEGKDCIISAKKHSLKQVFPFTERGRQEEFLLVFVRWGLKKVTDDQKQDKDMALLKGRVRGDETTERTKKYIYFIQ